MSDLQWPREYADLIPPGRNTILELFTRDHRPGVSLGETYFWLGTADGRGLAIQLDLSESSSHHLCCTHTIPRGELERIKVQLLEASLGTGSKIKMDMAPSGFVRVCATRDHEVAMKWWAHPSDLWSPIFSIIDEIRDRIISSPDRVEIPERPISRISDRPETSGKPR
jgi:hypothetical protein